MRLALKVGRLDWRQMLSELSPQEYIEWVAFERIEPYGQEWHQTSNAAAAVINELRVMMAGFGGKNLPADQHESPDFLVPGVATRKAAEQLDDAMESLDAITGL